jgi:hypothetical protein
MRFSRSLEMRCWAIGCNGGRPAAAAAAAARAAWAVAEAEAALGAALATIAPLAEALGTLMTWTDDLPCMHVLTTAPHSP